MLSLHIDTGRAWRGGQRQVYQTVLGLRAEEDRAILVAHPAGELFRRMREGHDVVPLGPRSEVDVAAAWKLSRVIKQARPDIVHAHDPHAVAMAATALAIAALTPRPPLVTTRHLDTRVARNSFSRWKYSQVDCVVAGSGASRDRLVSDGVPATHVVVISPGADVERIDRTPTANVGGAFWLPTDAPIVGNVAMLAQDKGHRYLINAAALVLPRVPDARFVIVGDGDLRPALEKQIRDRHLERHVVLAGFRADVIELTKGFDLFVSSSLTEGVSMAILDAMAAGKAVVATSTGSVPELVAQGETGFIVPPREEEALADRLVELLLDQSLRQRMGDAARARVDARFTLASSVRALRSLYESLVTRRT